MISLASKNRYGSSDTLARLNLERSREEIEAVKKSPKTLVDIVMVVGYDLLGQSRIQEGTTNGLWATTGPQRASLFWF